MAQESCTNLEGRSSRAPNDIGPFQTFALLGGFKWDV